MEIVSNNVQKRKTKNSEILRFVQNHPRDNRKKPNTLIMYFK